MRGVVAIGASSASCCGAEWSVKGRRPLSHRPERRPAGAESRGMPKARLRGEKSLAFDPKIIMYGDSGSQGEIVTDLGQSAAICHRSGSPSGAGRLVEEAEV